jgi:hypothetical protein
LTKGILAEYAEEHQLLHDLLQTYSIIQHHYNRSILCHIERHGELANTTSGLAYALLCEALGMQPSSNDASPASQLSDLLNAAEKTGLQHKPEVRLAASLKALPADTPSWKLPLPDIVGLLEHGVLNAREVSAAPQQAGNIFSKVAQGFIRGAYEGMRLEIDRDTEQTLLRACGCRLFDTKESGAEILFVVRLNGFLRW